MSNEKKKKEENKKIQKHKETKEKEERKKISEKTIVEKKGNNEYIVYPEKKSKRTIVIISIIISIFIILGLFSTIFALANIKNNTILENIYVKDINITGLTVEEARNKLNAELEKDLTVNIFLQYEAFQNIINGKQIEANYNIEEIVSKAYSIGRSGNIFENNFTILKSFFKKTEIETELKYDNILLEKLLLDVNAKLPGAKLECSYYFENDNVVVIPGKAGIVIKKEGLKNKILQAIETRSELDNNIQIPVENAVPEKINAEKIRNEVYLEPKNAYYTQDPFVIYPHIDGKDFGISIEEAQAIFDAEEKEAYYIPLAYTSPEITTNQLGEEVFPDLLSSFTTKYDASNTNRSTNLRLAAEKINGTVLLPGEEFSYNKTVGERTVQAGYKMAHIFAPGNRVVDGLGGGICQISTTLYNAALYANLQITDRTNHGLPAGYVKNGLDATVSWGAVDFKFVNSRNFPIKIIASVKNGVAQMQIFGIREEIEYEVKLEPITLSYTPYSTQYITDTNLEPGVEIVDQAGANGAKTVTYKYLYLNGTEISKEEISRDTYNPITKIVRIAP